MATVIDKSANCRCDNKFYVYAHIRLDNGDIFYVGKGYGRRAWRSTGRNRHWENVANKYGFKVEIIEKDLSEKEAFDLEIKKISDIGIENLCNYALGGGGSSGYKLTELQRNKQIAGLTGRIFSSETKAKLSASNKGKIRSKESRLRMSIARTGKKRSQESIEKQREAMRQRALVGKNEIYGKMMKPVTCSNGLKFNSLSDAVSWIEEAKGVSNSKAAIAKCASGKRKTAYGLVWHYDKGVLL